MGSLEDSSLIFGYHRSMIVLHGANSSFALGWRNLNDQQVRFEALCQIDDLNRRTVLDAGCGYADLYPYLKERYRNMEHYCGIEQIPELIDKAIRRYHHLPDVSFVSRNFLQGHLPTCDYVLASGSLNYGSTSNDFIYKAIDRLYCHCNIGLGFNLLSHVPANGTLAAYDPEDILNFCKTLSPRVTLKTDYAQEDFTIFMYR